MSFNEAIINNHDSPPVLAIVSGQAITEIPADLFIPPHALEILLDSFSGPLDLLLYLIRRQNIDILDIPIVRITQQYMVYIHLIEDNQLELAADYLVMAAMLAEIKSRLLLPPSSMDNEEIEEDPRLVLVRKLQAYEQMKNAALSLDQLARNERDIFRISIPTPTLAKIKIYPEVKLDELIESMRSLIKQQNHQLHHQISREPLSVRERMTTILSRMQQEKILSFHQLFTYEEGRRGLTVTFLAILELAKQSLVQLMQTGVFAPIHLQVINHE